MERLEPHAVYAGDMEWGAERDPEHLPGRTLREMRELLRGDEGYMQDRQGKRHWVSIRLWKDADPDSTRIVIKEMHGLGAGDEPTPPAE